MKNVRWWRMRGYSQVQGDTVLRLISHHPHGYKKREPWQMCQMFVFSYLNKERICDGDKGTFNFLRGWAVFVPTLKTESLYLVAEHPTEKPWTQVILPASLHFQLPLCILEITSDQAIVSHILTGWWGINPGIQGIKGWISLKVSFLNGGTVRNNE